MKITAHEEYGLRCLLRIARTEQALTIPQVAAAEGISPPYVGKLLAVLRRGGLIASARGRHGGYRLSRPAAAIGLGSVLLLLGGPLFDDPDYCQRHAGTSDGPCVHGTSCTLRGLWRSLEHLIRQALDRITLADLLQDEGHIPGLFRARLADAVEAALPLIPLGARHAH